MSPTTTAPRPKPASPREYRFPHFARRRLHNGIELVVAPVRKLPLVTVMAVADAGAVCDPKGREGTAQLTAKLLLEGTEANDGAELAERFEMLGASIDAYADWDAAIVTMTALSQHLPDAFALFGEVLRTPAFRIREVERLKAERLAELLQLRTEPRGLADEHFAKFVYTPSSRYALPDGGTERSVAAIAREHLLAFYESRYLPGGLSIIIVGDIDEAAAERLAERALGDWRAGTPTPVTTDDQPARRERAVHVVAKTDAPQSELRIGHVGLPRKHPDFFPVQVMNAILGGVFNSRINLNLREVHGYTYGAFSGFDWRRQAGPFDVSTAVQSDVTADAAREVLLEIDRIRAEPVTQEELSLATSYLDGVFPIRFESTAAIANALAVLVIHALPEDYYDLYREHVRSVGLEQVLRAAQQHLHPEILQMVVAGEPSVVVGPLDALGFGRVSTYDTFGAPIK